MGKPALDRYAVAFMSQGSAVWRELASGDDAFALVSASATVRQYVEATPGGADVWEKASIRAGHMLLDGILADADDTPKAVVLDGLDRVEAWADVQGFGDDRTRNLAVGLHGAALVAIVCAAVTSVR